MNKTPIQMRNAKLGAEVVKVLNERFFEAWYFDSRDLAIEKIISLIPKTDLVSWGGSMTVSELGIQERLSNLGFNLLDRDKASSNEERMEIMRKALLCDTFLTSANAISEDGCLVNIDGFGNRVAAIMFGPKQVIVVAGINKVVKTLDDALTRAQTVSAPMNMQRFLLKTPCAETGSCKNCHSADSICRHIVTTRLCKPTGRIKVILIGESLGF